MIITAAALLLALAPARAGQFAPPQPRVYPRSSWATQGPVGPIEPDPVKRRIIVHHADILVTPEMKNARGAASLAASEAYVRELYDLHVRREGWYDIGYHYVVDWEGRIFEGRDVNLLGAHSESANKGSIGVVLMGDLQDQHPTRRQLRGLKELLDWLSYAYDISPLHIGGHHHYDATACPGAFVEDDALDARGPAALDAAFASDPRAPLASPLKLIRCQLLAERGARKPDCDELLRLTALQETWSARALRAKTASVPARAAALGRALGGL